MVLSVVASSFLFATPSQATPTDRWVAATSPTEFYVEDTSGLSIGSSVSLKTIGSPNNLYNPFPGGVTITAISVSPTTFNLCNGMQYSCPNSGGFANVDTVYTVTVNVSIFSYYTLAEFTFSGGASTAPGAPTSVTATSTGATTANVSFTAPASNGGATITSYTATSSPGGITGSISQAGSGTIAMTGLTAGTAYTFTVTATNSAGTSAASTASNSTTTVGAPSSPTSVTATSTGATTANVSFTAPTSNGGATITSYTATSSPGGITGSISQAGSGTIAMTGLTAGTAYTFTVTATNSAGTSVASSASNSTTTVGAPTAPTTVVATATGKRSATVSFAAPASNGGSVVTSYTATSTPGGITQTLAQATGGTFNFDGLQPGTAYTFAVTATNAVGTSAATTSNEVKLEALIEASITSLTYTDDGTGTAGKLAWAGKYIDLICYTGNKSSYPYPFNYSGCTPTYDGTSSTWNGSLVNLIPGTKYSATIYALSADGVGESKTIEFTTTTVTAPAKVKSVVAKATGKRSATVSFATPEDDGNSPITSYKVVASPGNKSQTLSQASGANVTFSDLEPGTDYTFTVTATNKIGSSLPVLSNSVTTTALVIPSIDSITYSDDGTGTGGTIKWTGKNIASVKFLGSANNYPVNLAYGEYSTNWNGRVRNLTPETELTLSISAMSEDGVQITKSITFKTGSSLLNKTTDVLFKTALFKAGSQSDEIVVANQIPTIYSLIDLNATFEGESVKIKSLLDKFDNTKVNNQKAYLRLPSARPLNEKAISQSPQVCIVENQNTIRSIAPGYCVIAFTVTGLSQEPATLVKGFVFSKYAKL